MIDRKAIRDSLIEGYKPREVADSVCALCEHGQGPMSLHLLEASIPETSPIPPRFVPMSRSRGMIRGSFPVCCNCAQICSNCGIAIQSKKVRQAYEAIKATASPGCIVSAGNGYCRHLNLLKKIGQEGLPSNFKSPFERIGTLEDLNRPETEADGYRAGKYHIQRIFEGGMGRVFLVTGGGDPFVLKSVKGEVDEAAFLEEARTWVGVGRHENIVPAFWVDQVGSMLCVAAEYIPPDETGRSTLRDVIRFGSPSLQQILSWTADFCYGMEHAHSRGVRVHRDIKPENLLLGYGQLQITDFGIASAAPLEWSPSSEVADRKPIAGTPPYMPPEQWVGSEQDFRTDVYAFGIVLHELVFGRYPWPITSVQELRQAHSIGSRTLPPHSLSSVITRCIAVAPKDRFKTPQDLLAAIAVVANQLSLHIPQKPQPLDEHREELLARAFLGATGNREHALAAAQILTEKWPGFSKGWTQLGRIHLEANELHEALEASQRALKLDETRSPPWNNLGVIYSRLKDHDRAIAALERALVCDAQNSGAMSNLATVMMKLGRLREAISVLEQAIRIAPDKPHLWVNLGSTQQLLGQADLACEAFDRALQLTPRGQRTELAAKIAESKASSINEELVVDVGQLLKDGKFEAAIPLLIEGTKREPRNAKLWHNLSLAYLDLGQNHHARAAFLKLWELESTSGLAARNLMRIASQSKDWPEASRWCDKLAELPGMLVESLALRADLLSEQGLTSDARKLLLTAIQDHPNEPALFEMFGDLAVKGGAPAAAVQRGYGPALQILAQSGRQRSSLYIRIEQKHRAAVNFAVAEGSLIRKDKPPEGT